MKQLLTILTTLLALQCGAQEITGTVYSKSRTPLAGATVIIMQRSEVKAIATTDKDGHYAALLKPGEYYTIVVRADDTLRAKGIVAEKGMRTTICFPQYAPYTLNGQPCIMDGLYTLEPIPRETMVVDPPGIHTLTHREIEQLPY